MKASATVPAVTSSLATASVWTCPGGKAQDDGKQSTPKKPTTSFSIG